VKRPKLKKARAALWPSEHGITVPRPKRKAAFRLTHAIASAHASSLLCLDARAFGRSYALNAEGPAPIPTPVKPAGGNVALVTIQGPLTQRATMNMCGYSDGYDAIEERICTALLDPGVDSVVLAIDSPGGDAAGLFEAIGRIMAVKAQAKKPIFAYADETVASAAYALACVADKIVMPASGEVGSVGCLAIHCDESAANAADGLAYTVFRSGARKAEGNPIEPLTDAASTSMQARVDQLAAQFFALVSTTRGIPIESIKALEGAMFFGQQAIQSRLADSIGSLDSVLTAAASPARAGVIMGMTEAEQAEMDDLKARLAKLEAPPPPPSSQNDDDEDGTDDDALPGADDDMDDDVDAGPPPPPPAPPPPQKKSKAMKLNAETDARLRDMEKRLAERDAEIDELRAAELKRSLRATVGKAVAAGKVAPGLKDAWIEKAMLSRDPARYLELELATLPSHAAVSPLSAPVAVPGASQLTAEEREVCKQMRISEADFLKEKAALLAKKVSA